MFALLRSEITKSMLVGFIIGAIGLAVAQPGMAQNDARNNAQVEQAR